MLLICFDYQYVKWFVWVLALNSHYTIQRMNK